MAGVCPLCNLPYVPQGPICQKPIVHHALCVTITISYNRELFMHRIRVRVSLGSLCIPIPMCHCRELVMQRVKVRVTEGSVCVTISIYVTVDSSLCTGLRLGLRLQHDPFVS